MIKIGDKIKFDTYLPYNYMTSQVLRVTLDKKHKLSRRKITTQKLEKITKYKSILISNDTPLEGIYVGPFRKKLIRSYLRSEPEVRETIDIFGTEIPIVTTIHDDEVTRIDRYSHNPRRIDNPRILSKMAMIKVGRRLIGAPMSNVMKCNFGKVFRVI